MINHDSGYISFKYLDKLVIDFTSVMAAEDQNGNVNPLPSL